MSENAAIQPRDLCLDCGMCCGNYLHTHVEISPPDRDRLRTAGLYQSAAQDRFDFPCQFLDGACCTIYPSRPAVCAAYRCKMLAQAQDGAIGLGDAKGRLRKVAALRRDFEAAIPDEMTLSAAIAMATSEVTPDQRMPGHYLPMRLAFVALLAIIDRHLREVGEGVVGSRMG